jgi:uncharacterized RDD family membrane protein YckC
LGGWLIDFVILTIVGLIVNAPLHQIHNDRMIVRGTSTAHYHIGAGGVLIDAAIVILYGGLLCGSLKGQTVGMMATRVRAVDATTGTPIGFPRAFGRAVFEYLMVIVLFIPWIIDVLFPLWDGRNQTLHDKVTNTIVIRT